MPQKSIRLTKLLNDLGLLFEQALSKDEWHKVLVGFNELMLSAERETHRMQKSLISQINTQREALEHLLENWPLSTLLRNLIQKTEEFIPGTYAAVHIAHATSPVLELKAIGSMSPEFAAEMELIAIDENGCPTARAASLKREFLFSDIKVGGFEKDWIEFMEAYSMRAVHAFPIINSSKSTTAVLSLYSKNKLEIDHFSFEWLASMVNILRVSIDHWQVKSRLETERISLLAQSKMATLGEMAGGIAHEVNNPLFILEGYIDLMRMDINENKFSAESVLKFCDRLSDTTQRIARIVRTLKGFSRDASEDPSEFTTFDAIAKDTLELCKSRLHNHDVDIILGTSLSQKMIECRSVELSQVLLNLISNSLDAVNTLEERWIRIESNYTNTTAILTVTDSGGGISEEHRSFLFSPFFTTKPNGKGTGLGLSICKNILERHGGRIAYNEKSKNTQFIIEIPFRLTEKKSLERAS